MIRRITTNILILLTILTLSVAFAFAAEEETEDQGSTAAVRVFNRDIVTFRAPFLGVPVKERAKRTEEALQRLLAADSPGKVTRELTSQGMVIHLDNVSAFIMIPEDADSLQQENLEQSAEKAAKALQLVVKEMQEARNLKILLKATGYFVVATIILIALLKLAFRAKRWLYIRLSTLTENHAEKLEVGGESLMSRERLLMLVRRTVEFIYWAFILLMIYQWLGFVLSRFPYTRPWGERLNHHLIDLFLGFGSGILRTVPGLLAAFVIFLLAKFSVNLLKTVLDRVENGSLQLAWLAPDTVPPTRRLLSAAIWLFALVAAYPYLPGSGTEAFKGLSVLLGLMISLGASSLVNQAVSGLILMYTRPFRTGEQVTIAGTSGTVMELGLFSTHIQSAGVDMNLPNAFILGNTVHNYSRTIGDGFILEINVTIGYDTPWRQVHALLIEAAKKTPKIRQMPPPEVLQTALSDFYVNYCLACVVIRNGPTSRGDMASALHQNIQDVFNEHGIQIMSPNYISDPETPKTVPKEQWFTPPAKPAA